MNHTEKEDANVDSTNEDQSALSPDVRSSLSEEIRDLCDLHDHVTKVVAGVNIPCDEFSGYPDPERATFDLEPVLRMFVYMKVRDINQLTLHNRLKGTAYLWVRFGLGGVPTQQSISYNWRRRLSIDGRLKIIAVAELIRETASEHDIISENEPRIDLELIDDEEIEDEEILDFVEEACDRGLDEFESDRASNAKYDDRAFIERQAYLCMAERGTATRSKGLSTRFERISNHDEVPCPDTHLRTMKMMGSPPEQTTLDDFGGGQKVPEWKRIRDVVLEYFRRGLDQLIEEVKQNGGIREPVITAIDTTPLPFFVSPYKDDADVKSDDEPVVVNGKERWPKEDYPTMVHGLKDEHARGYEMSTITIIAEDTPIVLGIEPVRRNSNWETEDVDDTSQDRIVDRLLDQAEQHVDIHKVFCDRGFDAKAVRDAIDRRGMTYLIPKDENEDDLDDIEELEREAVTNVGVKRDVPHGYEDRVHTTSIMYVPARDDDDDENGDMGEQGEGTEVVGDGEEEEETSWAIFTTNRDVPLDRVQGFVQQYRWRWTIENEYKSIKKDFLPTIASKDYRVRFLYFAFGVFMHNIWRLTNLLFREAVDVDLGEDPPIVAGEVVEIIAFCIIPGD